ncbi:MAG: hypothetical protein HZC36_13425 [Armatimonadetes bacterium]|nr:hypothetical protein [Armatimonadota bacterium]
MNSPAPLLGFLLLLQGSPQSGPALFQDAQLGLSFEYPRAWKLTQKKTDAKFVIPSADGSESILEIHRAGYIGPEDNWELTQLQIANSQRLEVVRQWREVILGVPLLLTKTEGAVGGSTKTILQGLVFSQTEQKMLFRLVCPQASFEEVEFAVRGAFESLRTLDGSLPKPEDPNRIPEPPGKGKPKPAIAKPPPIVEVGKGKAQIEVKGSVKATLRAAGKDVTLRLPEGSKVEGAEANAITVSFPGLPGTFRVTAASTLDSVAPGRALLKASVASLSSFEKSNEREETTPKKNLAGAYEAHTWRTGQGKEGAIASFESAGASGDLYFVLTWIGPPGEGGANKATLVKIVAVMCLEPTP